MFILKKREVLTFGKNIKNNTDSLEWTLCSGVSSNINKDTLYDIID